MVLPKLWRRPVGPSPASSQSVRLSREQQRRVAHAKLHNTCLHVGITNQRETTVAWSKSTGKALCNAIVWDDARTKGTVKHYNRLMDENGLVLPDGTVKKGKEGRRYLTEL